MRLPVTTGYTIVSERFRTSALREERNRPFREQRRGDGPGQGVARIANVLKFLSGPRLVVVEAARQLMSLVERLIGHSLRY